MIVPSEYYRLNPTRALFVSGVIDEGLLSRLTPEILRLQSESRAPITVYIDSPGGSISALEALQRLLKASDQDSSDPCHIITAAVSYAASAAADLLSFGDYAVAFPSSTVLYHGVRTQDSSPLTVERTSNVGWFLRVSNDRYAMTLARKVEERFSFRFITVRNKFHDLRSSSNRQSMSDVECFMKVVDGNLSTGGRSVWERARKRYSRYEEIFSTIIKKSRGDFARMTRAQVEGLSIKAIVDFEIKTNKQDQGWTFGRGGFQNLADDFYLLNGHLAATGDQRLRKWSVRFGKLVLPKEDVAAIDAIADQQAREEKLVDAVRPILEPLWSFFIALCHALQDGENELTAHDAYWMGLVDEVVGDSTLMTFRRFVEFHEDPPTDGSNLEPTASA